MGRSLLPMALLALVAALGGTAVAASPDLDAIVSYETRQVLANGTTRVETWQERLTRRADRVATERVLPPTALAAHAHEHEREKVSKVEHLGHKHFDVDRTTRVLRLVDKAQVELAYVDREQRRVVSVPKAEWAAVGFDGRYDAAAHLVPPALIASLPVQADAETGSQWHVQKNDGWTHRVLWSWSKQVALRIESRRDDGSVNRVVTLKPATALPASQLPWNEGVAGYQQMVYDDFMD